MMLDQPSLNPAPWRPRGAFAVVAVVLIFTAAAAAQRSGQPGPNGVPPAAMLLQQMHMANQMQIKAAALARQKASDVLVQRLADRLRRDHQVADGKVRMLAGKLGYQLKSPSQMRQSMQSDAMGSPEKMQQVRSRMQAMQQMLAKLQSTPEPQFDQVYAKAMAKSQQNMLQMLQQARTQAKPPVKKLLGKLIPILGQHVALAQFVMTHVAQPGAGEVSR